jgi:quercetin 2,3-dioxygenase
MTLSRRDFLKVTAGTAAYSLMCEHIAAAAEVNAGLKQEAIDQLDAQTPTPMNEFRTRWRSRSHLPGRLQPYFVEAQEGDRAILFDQLITTYAGADETNNSFCLFTVEGPKGDIIPAHLHGETHECFYILAGQLRLFLDDQHGTQLEKVLNVGDFGFVPANVIHTYRMERHGTRILGVASRPDFPRFLETLGKPTEAHIYPKTQAEMVIPTPEDFVAAGRQYDVRFLPEYGFAKDEGSIGNDQDTDSRKRR